MSLISLNRYVPYDTNGNLLSTIVSVNVSIARYGVSQVTILILDFLRIH